MLKPPIAEIKFNVQIRGKGAEFVQSLLQKGYICDFEDYIHRAGELLEWAIKTIESGDEVAAFNNSKMSVTTLQIRLPKPENLPQVQKKKQNSITLVIDNTK